jgi:hypothetical protein
MVDHTSKMVTEAQSMPPPPIPFITPSEEDDKPTVTNFDSHMGGRGGPPDDDDDPDDSFFPKDYKPNIPMIPKDVKEEDWKTEAIHTCAVPAMTTFYSGDEATYPLCEFLAIAFSNMEVEPHYYKLDIHKIAYLMAALKGEVRTWFSQACTLQPKPEYLRNCQLFTKALKERFTDLNYKTDIMTKFSNQVQEPLTVPKYIQMFKHYATLTKTNLEDPIVRHSYNGRGPIDTSRSSPDREQMEDSEQQTVLLAMESGGGLARTRPRAGSRT